MKTLNRIFNIKVKIVLISVALLSVSLYLMFFTGWEITDADLRVFTTVGEQEQKDGSWVVSVPKYLNVTYSNSSATPNTIKISSSSANRFLVNYRDLLPGSKVAIYVSNISIIGNLTFDMIERDLNISRLDCGAIFPEYVETHIIFDMNAKTVFGEINVYTIHKILRKYNEYIPPSIKIRTKLIGIPFCIFLSSFVLGAILFLFEYPNVKIPFITPGIGSFLLWFYIRFGSGRDFLVDPNFGSNTFQLLYRMISFIPQIGGYDHLVGNIFVWFIIGLLIELWLKKWKIFVFAFIIKSLLSLVLPGFGLSGINIFITIMACFEIIVNYRVYFSTPIKIHNVIYTILTGGVLGMSFLTWFPNLLLDGNRLVFFQRIETIHHLILGIIYFCLSGLYYSIDWPNLKNRLFGS